MKIGDLVKWNTENGSVASHRDRSDMGIIVDGPRDDSYHQVNAISYAVAWFDAKETFWHYDANIEVISENR
jgi:hypothetical protein